MDKAKKDLSIIEHILAYCAEVEQPVYILFDWGIKDDYIREYHVNLKK